MILGNDPKRYLGDPTLLVLGATREAPVAPSNSSAVLAIMNVDVSAAIPETSSLRPRVKANPGDDDIPAAPVVDDSTGACGPTSEEVSPAIPR